MALPGRRTSALLRSKFGFRIGIATRTRQCQECHVSEVIDEYLTSRSLVKDGTTQAVFDTEMQNSVLPPPASRAAVSAVYGAPAIFLHRSRERQ